MEATFQANKQTTNIAINIATMKANIQASLQESKQRVLKELSLPRLYRRQLRMVYALARAAGKHPAVTDALIWLMGIAVAVEVLLFA